MLNGLTITTAVKSLPTPILLAALLVVQYCNGTRLEGIEHQLQAIEKTTREAGGLAKDELKNLQVAINGLQKEVEHLPTKLENILLKRTEKAD